VQSLALANLTHWYTNLMITLLIKRDTAKTKPARIIHVVSDKKIFPNSRGIWLQRRKVTSSQKSPHK